MRAVLLASIGNARSTPAVPVVLPTNLTLIETLTLGPTWVTNTGWKAFTQLRCTAPGRRYLLKFANFMVASAAVANGSSAVVTYDYPANGHFWSALNITYRAGGVLGAETYVGNGVAAPVYAGNLGPLPVTKNVAFDLYTEFGMGMNDHTVAGTRQASWAAASIWRHNHPQLDPCNLQGWFLTDNLITADSVTLWERTAIKNVVMIGDSRTQADAWWAALDTQSETANGNRSTIYYNMGLAGYTIADCQSASGTIKVDHLYAAASQNIALVAIGINDLKAGTSAAACLTALQTLVTTYVNAGWSVWLTKIAGCSNAGLITGGDVAACAARVAAYNAGLAGITGIAGVIDPTVNAHYTDTTDATYYSDGLHLTAFGNAAFATYTVAAIG